MNIIQLIKEMTLEEKASLMSGFDMWHTKAIERLGIPSIMMTDGPHGLRKQTEEHASDVHDSVKCTCFPTASCIASTWDLNLATRVGSAIGEEAQQENVGIVLGPGANIKRNSTCGRNFEYYSEDPTLSGKMAGAFIRGLQSQGVGASLKHFLANNQETRRMTVSSEIDSIALNEIYLKSFEIAVKEGQPKTVMCSYNRLNGEFCCENKYALTEVLRDKWGFEGIVMSDWGATNNRAKGVDAGLELEMPSSGGVNDIAIIDAVKAGELDEAVLDNAVSRLLDVVFWVKDNEKKDYRYNQNEHMKLAKEVVEQGSVLLKNQDNILPLKRIDDILVVGEMAKKPRYQGAGSSHIVPTKLVSLFDALKNEEIHFDYERGYNINNGNRTNPILIKNAVAKAKKANKVVIATGLTDEYEAEGYDRQNIYIPKSHLVLISEILKVNKNVIILLANGSPVALPFKDEVKAILLNHLGGQNVGSAVCDLLFGKANPSGRLAETYPLKLDDISSYNNLVGDFKSVKYAESVYVGYRYFSTAKKDVCYPFGYGLSYTQFDYSDLEIENTFSRDGMVKLSFYITNVGAVDGAEIPQVYISLKDKNLYSPDIELVGFKKVFIAAGECVRVEIFLDKDAFSRYIPHLDEFHIVGGMYDLFVSKNCNESILSASVEIDGESFDQYSKEKDNFSWYYNPTDNNPPIEQFERLLGRKIEDGYTPPKKGEFTIENTFEEMAQTSRTVRCILRCIKFVMKNFIMKCRKNDAGLLMMYETVRYSRIKNVSYSSQGMVSAKMAESLIIMFNGKFFKGLTELINAYKVMKKERKGVKTYLG